MATSRPNRTRFAGLGRGRHGGEAVDWPAIHRYERALDRWPASPGRDRLRDDLRRALRLAWLAAVQELAVSDSPARVVAEWLAVGVHPGWVNPLELSGASANDDAYPAYYFAALAALNDPRTERSKKEAAAEMVDLCHKDHELFDPRAGLPLERVRASGAYPLSLTIGNQTKPRHAHAFRLVATNVDPSFADQVLGWDVYLESLVAAEQDQFPHSSYASRVVGNTGRLSRSPRTTRGGVRYATTRYSAGWMFGDGGWQIDRHELDHRSGRDRARPCCDTSGPLVAPPWEPTELIEHLNVEPWLVRKSSGLVADLPALPEGFDRFLFSSPLGAVHRRILEARQIVEQQLFGRPVRVADKDDIPPAGRAASRIAWLDRTGFHHPSNGEPRPHGSIGDWSPYRDLLRRALSVDGPFAALLAGCLAVADYVRTILAGGLGPAFRFSSPTPDAIR